MATLTEMQITESLNRTINALDALDEPRNRIVKGRSATIIIGFNAMAIETIRLDYDHLAYRYLTENTNGDWLVGTVDDLKKSVRAFARFQQYIK
jgi:hypothetical protein